MDENKIAVNRFQKLEVWRRAHELVLSVYAFSETLPETERYGLAPDLRRSAVSVPANIVVGFRRYDLCDRRRCYDRAQSALEELRYYFMLCRDLGFLTDYGRIEGQSERLARLIGGLKLPLSMET